MTISLIAYGLLVGTLVAVMAAALERAGRLAGRPTRFIWALALGLTVGLVAAAPRRFGAGPAALDGVTARVRESGVMLPRHVPSVVELAATALREAAILAGSTVDRALAAVGAAPRWLELGAAAAWLALAAGLIAVFGAVYVRFARARRHWPAMRLHDTPVRVAPQAGPAVIGLARPEIVVPSWLLERSGEEQRLVIAHESEHVRARDPLLLAVGCLAVAILPWHPAAWWMLGRLRLAVELDCDARVLRRGVAPRSYGSLLIDLAGRCSGLRVGAPALADETSHLELRLLAMKRRTPRFAAARSIAFAGAALLALLAACEAKLPTATEVADMNAASAERGARKIALISAEDSGATTYKVDGVVVSAAAAKAIAAEKIASIEVEKRETASGKTAVISILTRKPGEPAGGHDVLVRMNGDTTFAAGKGEMKVRHFGGIVLIDGVRVPESAMNSIPPGDIVSVEVVKGAAATKLFDAPEAVNGVIKITTKKGAERKQ